MALAIRNTSNMPVRIRTWVMQFVIYRAPLIPHHFVSCHISIQTINKVRTFIVVGYTYTFIIGARLKSKMSFSS